MKIFYAPIFRLLWAERRYSNTWYLLVLALLGTPPLFSLAVVPVADNPGVIASTTAQTTYIVLTIILFGYYILAAVNASHRQRYRGFRLVWRSLGITDAAVFIQAAGVFLLESALLSAFGFFLCWAWGNKTPGWAVTCLQSGICLWLAACVTYPIAVGLAQRLSPGLALLFALAINLGGLYGLPVMDVLRNNPQTSSLWQIISEKIWAVLPQLCLADQAERITFSWPPMSWIGFGAMCLYFIVWVGISSYVGYKLFRCDPVAASLKAGN